MKLEKPSPETHPIGTDVVIKTIDNIEIAGVIEAYTNDAVHINNGTIAVRIHPHEIYSIYKIRNRGNKI